jgi:hypothetical protein
VLARSWAGSDGADRAKQAGKKEGGLSHAGADHCGKRLGKNKMAQGRFQGLKILF